MHDLARDLPGILTIAGIAIVLLVTADLMKRLTRLPVEATRKFAHVANAVLVLVIPLFVHTVIGMAVLSGSMALLMLVTWQMRLLGGVHNAGRGVGGVFLYPFAALGLYWFAMHERHGDWAIYIASMLVLGLGDAAGAVIGKRFGRHPYRVWMDRRRTYEGSLACFAASFPAVLVPLLAATHLAVWQAVLVSGTAAWFATAIEAVATNGRDNLLMPIGTMLLLDRLLHATPSQQAWFAVAAVLITVGIAVTIRRSSWPVGGVAVAVISAFFLDALGGTAWLLPVVGVFAAQLLVSRRRSLRRRGMSVMNGLLLVPVVLCGLRWVNTSSSLRHELFVADVCTLAATGAILWYLLPCPRRVGVDPTFAQRLSMRLLFATCGAILAVVCAPSLYGRIDEVLVGLVIALPGLGLLAVQGWGRQPRTRLVVAVNGMSAAAIVGIGMAVR